MVSTRSGAAVLLGVEFDSPGTSKAVFDALLEADVGLLTKRGGRDYRTLIFWFALNIPHEELDCIKGLLMDALSKVLQLRVVSHAQALCTSRGCARGWPGPPRYEEPVGVLQLPSGRDEMLSPSISAVPCGEFGEAHLLSNALSIAECNDIIAQAVAIGLQRLDLGRGSGVTAASAGQQLRGNSRVGLESNVMSEEMWRRISPMFQPVVVSAARRGPGDEGLEPGVWRPIGLGDVWRIARYHEVGDFIGPHVDDHVVLGPRVRSLKTFNLYLNGTGPEGFSGGPFNFLRWTDDGHTEAVSSIVPTAGSAVIFDDFLLHEGGAITGGEKWIFRSEILYELDVLAGNAEEV